MLLTSEASNPVMKDMQSDEGKIMWIDKDSSINEWMNECIH